MKKTTVNNKEFELGKISVDLYEEYMDIAEKVDKKNRYTRADLEEMAKFVCKAYGDQFTVEELKDPETGLDAAGLKSKTSCLHLQLLTSRCNILWRKS